MEREQKPFRIVALLSAPMVGWNPHWGCVQEALLPFGIQVRLGGGAYWHQTMQHLLEQCADADNLDWVLTLDYDSIFTRAHVQQLFDTMANNPYIDALAALQCRRGTIECPLLNTGDGKDVIAFNGNPVKVKTAHFGLTLFKVSAFKDLPKPWFVGKPGPTGSYDDQRVDADINFWLHWQEHGRTVYVDPQCSIGHLQPMVAEFQEVVKDGKTWIEPRHVHVHEYRGRTSEVGTL